MRIARSCQSSKPCEVYLNYCDFRKCGYGIERIEIRAGGVCKTRNGKARVVMDSRDHEDWTAVAYNRGNDKSRRECELDIFIGILKIPRMSRGTEEKQ